jgi:hypothetical protein
MAGDLISLKLGYVIITNKKFAAPTDNAVLKNLDIYWGWWLFIRGTHSTIVTDREYLRLTTCRTGYLSMSLREAA